MSKPKKPDANLDTVSESGMSGRPLLRSRFFGLPRDKSGRVVVPIMSLDPAARRAFEQAQMAARVEAARDPSHPDHGKFTWDDDKAAEQYRLEQADELARSINVTFTPTTRTRSRKA